MKKLVTPLYTPEERKRRDETVWTVIQGVLAPVQFLVCFISICLVVRFLMTGQGYAIANLSVLIKTIFLLTIMVTGSIWEKVVFGQYLFAKAFFWEDLVSMLVIALHLSYVVSVYFSLLGQTHLMWLALLAYSTYIVNAVQFLAKLRQARRNEAQQEHYLPSGMKPELSA